jgi:hypothetical protein
MHTQGWSLFECRDKHGASALDWAAGAGDLI